MNNAGLISLAATIASLVLSIVAIGLSITFFILSTKLADKSLKAAEGINLTVEQIEKLFDKFYSDTFSLTRDIVMSSISPQKQKEAEVLIRESESKTEAKIDELKASTQKDMSRIFKENQISNQTLIEAMNKLMEKAINTSSRAEKEVKGETYKTTIVRFLNNFVDKQDRIFYYDLITQLGLLPPPIIFDEIIKLKNDGFIAFSGDMPNLTTIILLNRDKIRGYFK